MADTNFSPGTVVASSWLDDVNSNTYTILSTVVGVDVITANGASTVTVGYPRGIAFRFLPVGNNTGAVTININGLGVRAMTKYGTIPLVAGDLVTGSWAYFAYDGTRFQLLNPLSVPTNVSALPGRLIGVQTFTASGTYTPTAGTTRVFVNLWGAGGAGGGAVATGASQMSVGGGGGGGGYTQNLITSAFSGVTVTIGTGGTGVSGGVGNTGGTSSFGVLLSASGGTGGAVSAAGLSVGAGGGDPGTGSLGTLNMTGSPGDNAAATNSGGATFLLSGAGGLSPNGGGYGKGVIGAGTGGAGTGGAGGAGSGSFNGSGAVAGGAGGNGFCVVYEYS